MSDINTDLQKQVESTVALEIAMAEKARVLATAQKQINDTWKQVEKAMIDNNIKTIKGDWGSITVAERTSWDVDMNILPKRFIKKVADTAKIKAAFELEGEAPKGVTPKRTKYLTKRIKDKE